MTMFVLGVTGPSGAGKGTACEILAEYGFVHIDTDRLVPSLYPTALPKLVEAFGNGILSDGAIDKKALARAAFASPEATQTLNSILHPLVIAEVERLIARAGDVRGVAVDGAALHEANAERLCHKTVAILAPKQVRLDRVLSRDCISEKAVRMRFSAQKNSEYYKTYSDRVIINEDLDQLRNDLLDMLKEWNV